MMMIQLRFFVVNGSTVTASDCQKMIFVGWDQKHVTYVDNVKVLLFQLPCVAFHGFGSRGFFHSVVNMVN